MFKHPVFLLTIHVYLLIPTLSYIGILRVVKNGAFFFEGSVSRGPSNAVIFSDVTILLSLTVFLNTVSESMPNTSDAVPLISML